MRASLLVTATLVGGLLMTSTASAQSLSRPTSDEEAFRLIEVGDGDADVVDAPHPGYPLAHGDSFVSTIGNSLSQIDLRFHSFRHHGD